MLEIFPFGKKTSHISANKNKFDKRKKTEEVEEVGLKEFTRHLIQRKFSPPDFRENMTGKKRAESKQGEMGLKHFTTLDDVLFPG